jgi:hypothetical protein
MVSSISSYFVTPLSHENHISRLPIGKCKTAQNKSYANVDMHLYHMVYAVNTKRQDGNMTFTTRIQVSGYSAALRKATTRYLRYCDHKQSNVGNKCLDGTEGEFLETCYRKFELL